MSMTAPSFLSPWFQEPRGQLRENPPGGGLWSGSSFWRGVAGGAEGDDDPEEDGEVVFEVGDVDEAVNEEGDHGAGGGAGEPI